MALFDDYVNFFKNPSAFKIPDFQLPEWIAKINRKLPTYPHSFLLCSALNWAKKKGVLPEDDLEKLTGKNFCVEMLDGGTQSFFTFDGNVFKVLFNKSADVYFKAQCAGFLQLLLRQEDPDTLFFKRQLQLEGETELGLFIKNMLDSIEIPKFAPPGFSR